MNSNKMTVSVAKIVELLDLKSFNDIDLKSRKITCSDVNRPALQLTGYFNHFEQSRVQIIGNVEYAYTQGLTQAQRKENYDKFLSIRAVSSFGGFANAQFNRMKHSLIANGQNPDTELEMLKHSLDNAMTAFNATHQGTAIDVQIRMVSDQELKRIHPEIKTASEYDKHHILVNGHFNEVDVTDFKTVISELHKIQSEYGKLNKENTKKTDIKLAKHMMDLVYIYLVGADLNSGKGMITYREKEHDMLMDIRNMKYLTSDGLKVKSDFYDLLNDVEKEYMYTAKNCVLPEEPDYEAISDMKRQVYLDILAR